MYGIFRITKLKYNKQTNILTHQTALNYTQHTHTHVNTRTSTIKTINCISFNTGIYYEYKSVFIFFVHTEKGSAGRNNCVDLQNLLSAIQYSLGLKTKKNNKVK